MSVEALVWPLDRLGEGLELLARRTRLQPAATAGWAVPETVLNGLPEATERWMNWACTRLGIDDQAVDATVPEVALMLRRAAPALLLVHTPQGRGFVLLQGHRGDKLRLIATDLRIVACPVETLRSMLCARFEAPLVDGLERLLADADVAPGRRPGALNAMLAERLAAQRVSGCWILRRPATASFWSQLAHARLPRRVGWMLAVFALTYAAEIEAWRLIGGAALDGRLDLGWLTAWALLMLTLVPLHLWSGWLEATLAIDGGRLLKQRLLAGALRLNPDTVRHLGAGQLLGRVMESQALEALALGGGLAVLVAVLELAFAGWILWWGAAGGLHLALMVSWLVVTAVLARRLHVRLERWTAGRLDMTHQLVERMVGHRTRLAQERPARRDAQEDGAMSDYLGRSHAMDAALVPIAAGVPGGWIVLSLAALAPALASGTSNGAALAVSLGGILFAHRAFNGIAGGLASLSRAGIAWGQVADVFDAGAADTQAGGPFIDTSQVTAERMADASELVYRYRPEGEPVLRGASLAIRAGERVLLEGASGGGKSTLASLLVGLRRPDSGLLLMGGLDRHTLGEQWHALATEAPQFHENHVLAGALAFNLLMGRHWPASEQELQEAQDLCEELGLGELVARMPSGLAQRVGETGWQLSHGERSRVFLARALLQNAPLTVLDESFAALDPPTLQRCLQTALRRAQTLVVIAHP